jgi:hypothetical protein
VLVLLHIGLEFVNLVISELCSMCPEHRKPQHCQFQGSTEMAYEMANLDDEDMLATEITQNKWKYWPSWLKCILFYY